MVDRLTGEVIVKIGQGKPFRDIMWSVCDQANRAGYERAKRVAMAVAGSAPSIAAHA